jgi:hypothetical protein
MQVKHILCISQETEDLKGVMLYAGLSSIQSTLIINRSSIDAVFNCYITMFLFCFEVRKVALKYTIHIALWAKGNEPYQCATV